MPVPGWPGTVLVGVHAEMALSFLEALLDGPAHG